MGIPRLPRKLSESLVQIVALSWKHKRSGANEAYLSIKDQMICTNRCSLKSRQLRMTSHSSHLKFGRSLCAHCLRPPNTLSRSPRAELNLQVKGRPPGRERGGDRRKVQASGETSSPHVTEVRYPGELFSPQVENSKADTRAKAALSEETQPRHLPSTSIPTASSGLFSSLWS